MKPILTLIILFAGICGYSQTVIKNVDAATFKKLIDEHNGILIDLRTTDELVNKGMIPGAKQIDFLDKNSEAVIAKLDKNKKYLIYCASGRRSGNCAALMEKLGFKDVINLEKGFEDWKKNGFEVKKDQ
jgi:rhodanese-related sulfurtransferase